MKAARALLAPTLLLFAVSAHASDYHFVVIADFDPSDAEGVVGQSVSINSEGEVGFLVLRSSPELVDDVYRGAGGPLTPIAAGVDIYSEAGANSATSIDAEGAVSFVGNLPPQGPLGLLAGSGASVEALVPASSMGIHNFVLFRGSDTGFQGFVAAANAVFHLYRRELDASLTPLADEGSGASDILSLGRYQLGINASGTVATFLELGDGSRGIGRSDGDSFGAIVGQSQGFVPQPYVIDIDDAGNVLFLATPSTSPLGGGLYLASGGSPAPLVDSSGPFANFLSGALSAAGDLVFQANLDSGPSATGGLFTGTDPVADKVIAVGDPLAGSTVSNLNLGDMNDAGQIAFYAGLADGRDLVVRADPVPEPSASTCAGAALLGLAARFAARRGR